MAVLGQAHREVFWVLSSKGMQPKLTALAPIRPHFEYFKNYTHICQLSSWFLDASRQLVRQFMKLQGGGFPREWRRFSTEHSNNLEQWNGLVELTRTVWATHRPDQTCRMLTALQHIRGLPQASSTSATGTELPRTVRCGALQKAPVGYGFCLFLSQTCSLNFVYSYRCSSYFARVRMCSSPPTCLLQ